MLTEDLIDAALQRMLKRCTKNYYAGSQPLLCSENLCLATFLHSAVELKSLISFKTEKWLCKDILDINLRKVDKNVWQTDNVSDQVSRW